jgi:hypothetical protein
MWSWSITFRSGTGRIRGTDRHRGLRHEHASGAGGVGDFQPGDELEVDFRMECWLTPQGYTLTVATQNADGTSHDWLDDAIAFEVADRRSAAGVANLRARVEWRVSR